METTTRTECSAAPLELALELGSTKWVLAFGHVTQRVPRIRTIAAGDLTQLQEEVTRATVRFGVPPTTAVHSCYEAGRDGFWLHRWLTTQGVTNVVVDSSSIEVNRRQRRAKTDRLDATRLVALLRRWRCGEAGVWSVVRVPTPEAEAARQLPRERTAVVADRTRVRNRLRALLIGQGIRIAVTARLPEQLASLRTGDGRAVAVELQDRLRRELAHLATLETRLRELEAAHETRRCAGTDRVAVVTRRLCEVRGVAARSALVLSTELLGTRAFQNGRQLGALVGLVPVPYRSDQRVTDQGISKAGRGELRRIGLQLAWGWLRWQPASDLTQWFHRRFGGAGGRSRRIGIVAVARKLLIALWRFVEQGVVPPGAILKRAA